MPVDFMGQTFGGYDVYPSYADETEEERRRRLALEAEANMPTKQTITYDNRTGAQKVKIEGSATNLSQMNPATPTVAGPVAPQDIYGRMIQAESGGRQFGPGGQVLTSPRGAMGVGQIMPSTAMQPGYGVTNIFDLAQQRGVPVPSRDIAGAQQLLGNEQLNREFGQNYYNAMNQRFGTEGGVAAYNAGPGRVGQNLQANAGQLNTAQLPDETQAYIQRVLGKMPGYVPGQPTGQEAIAQTPAQQPQPIINDQGRVIGAETPAQMMAGAATNAPVAPVAPGAEPQGQMISTQAPAPQTAGPVGEQMGPSTQFMTPQGWAERLNTAKQDDRMLANLAYDPNMPQYVRQEASEILFNKLNNAKLEAEAKQKWQSAMTSGDLSQINREMKKDTKEGSWLKYLFYGFVDPNMAKNERLKLFPEEGSKVVSFTSPDGQTTGIMRIGQDNRPISGKTADGRSLSENELIKYYSGVSGDYDIVGGTFVSDTMKDSQGNPMVGSLYRNKKNPSDQFIQTSEGRKPLSGFRPQSSQGSLSDMRGRLIQEMNIKLQGKTEEEKMAITRDYNARLVGQGFPPIQPYEVQLAAPQIGGGAPAPAQGGQPSVPTVPQAQPGGAPAAQPSGAPAAQPGAPATGQRPTMTTLEAQAGAQKKIVDDASKIVAEQDAIIKGFEDTKRNLKFLESGRTNFGTIIGGTLPGERAIGSLFKTDDAVRTKNVMEQINMKLARSAKLLGVNPTDRDLIFLTTNSPDESWNEKDVADWLRRWDAAERRTLEIAKKQIETGGTYQAPVPEPTPESTSNLSPQDRARQELERRKNEKK